MELTRSQTATVNRLAARGYPSMAVRRYMRGAVSMLTSRKLKRGFMLLVIHPDGSYTDYDAYMSRHSVAQRAPGHSWN